LKIDNERTHANLSSAIRLRILSYYRERRDVKALGNKPARR
jgi:predicted DNA-binding ribbon-helix-helix protein